MPATPRPGKIGRYIEMPAELDADLTAYCERVGSKYAVEVREAVRRHLAHPPNRQPAPLPAKRKKS